VLVELYPALTGTRTGDNVLYVLADLAENDLEAPADALAHLDRLAVTYPSRADSGLYDDALWHGARLARAAGDARGAAARLSTLLDSYEVASLGIGSPLSVWLDDAQLELGRVLRDDLGAHAEALAAFRRLPRDYPDSILVDDAGFEAALTLARMGRAAEACAALAELRRDWPDSRYELERAPALRTELGCQ
jgi:tetratricopeptide (TPR) repeat protein